MEPVVYNVSGAPLFALTVGIFVILIGWATYLFEYRQGTTVSRYFFGILCLIFVGLIIK
jgi:hypothetical protein